VSATDRGDAVAFAVADDGPGIPEAEREEIFEFFSVGTNGDGTGMGLAICQRIVERHDGSIHVDSTVGEGTMFYFTLPAVGTS